MRIMSAKLSGKAKAKAMLTRTEGLKQNSSQGQSVDRETVKQNIIDPRVRTISLGDEKVRRYSIEKWRFKIKNLIYKWLSPKQVWGGKGIISLLHNTALDTAGSSTTDTATARPIGLAGSKGEEAFQTGFVGSIAGFNVYWSDQIDENVGSGGDAAGFAFSKGAVGLGVGAEGLFRIATQREESERMTKYVATGFWGEVEIKDAYGVYILSDVS